MSVISKQREKQKESKGARSQSTQSPVIGKVSIGRPASEPVLVEHAEGLKSRFGIKFGDGTGLPKGKTIRESHIEKMKAMGKREVQVVYGKSPTTLDHFRLLRKSNYSDGYVEDPALYERFDLEPGENLTEIPIMLTSEDVDSVLQTRMVNYDREANCVFCSSGDGETAMRRRTDGEEDGEGDYLPGGSMKEVECIPFYHDPRVESGDKEICPFREAGGNGRDCKFTGSLYFQILNEDGSFDLGRYFKIETTSARTAEYYMDALVDENDGIRAQLNRISFVPLKLEIVKEQTVRPGNRYNDRKRSSVFRTTISVDSRYLKKYKPVVEEIMDTIDGYKQMNQRLGISTGNSGPFAIPEENAPAEEPDRWEAEFDPQNYQKKLEEEGIADAAAEAEEKGPETPQIADDEGEEGDPEGSGEDGLSGGAYELKKKDVIKKARCLDPETYDEFREMEDRVNPDTIDKVDKHLDGALENLDEEEMKENFEVNKKKDKKSDGDDLPF